MQYTYPHTAHHAHPSALVRALQVWLFSNLGGTAALALDFGFDSHADLAVALVIGLMAALISLAYVPLAVPFLALSHRACTGWRCRLTAGLSVITVFMAANYLLLHILPIGSFSVLLNFSRPYLGAALLAVAWLYRPKKARPAPAAPLLLRTTWQPQSARWPMVLH